MNMQEATSKMKADSYKMAALSEDTRNNILAHVKDALIAHKDEIFAANAKDMAAAEENGIAASVKKRLKFDEHKLADVTNGINELIKLADPVGQIQLKRELDEGLVLQRVTCPIGVIGIIFEARPDALVQISSLCIKSGNCAVLKGGKETANTNKALFDVIYSTAVANGSQVLHMLTVVIVGLAMGTTVIVGHAIGARNTGEAATVIGNSVTLFMTVAVGLMGILIFSVRDIVNLINTPSEAI